MGYKVHEKSANYTSKGIFSLATIEISKFIHILNESFLKEDVKSRFIRLVSLRMSLFEK